MDPLILLDGGLATALQAVGLPPFTPVEPWLVAHPDRIRAAHTAFRGAGSAVLLTATFRCLPSERPDWRSLVDVAIPLARSAADGADVWLSLGPGEGHAEVVTHVLAGGESIDGLCLETFVDSAEALRTLKSVRSVYEGAVVVSLVPGPDGQPLGGGDFTEAALQLVGAGATGVGVNCASGPACIAAVTRIPDGVPVWAKPSGDALQAEAFRMLAPRVRWLGGCCGTSPRHIRQLAIGGP